MANGDITIVTNITGTLTNGDAIKPFSHTKTYSSIADIIQRTVTAPTTVATIVTVAAAKAGASLPTISYFKLKNTDSTNYGTVGLMSAADSSYQKVPAGCSFEITSPTQDTNTDASAFSAFVAFTSISYQANTAATVIEYICF